MGVSGQTQSLVGLLGSAVMGDMVVGTIVAGVGPGVAGALVGLTVVGARVGLRVGLSVVGAAVGLSVIGVWTGKGVGAGETGAGPSGVMHVTLLTCELIWFTELALNVGHSQITELITFCPPTES